MTPEERMERDIAALRGAKGLDVRGFIAENKVFGLVVLSFLGLIGLYVAYATYNDQSWIEGVVAGAVCAPVVMIRMLLKHGGRER